MKIIVVKKKKKSKDIKTELNNLDDNSSVNSEKLIFKHDEGKNFRNSRKTNSPYHNL